MSFLSKEWMKYATWKKKNDFNKLTYYYKIPGLAPLNVIGFKGTLHIYSEINMVKYHQ